MKRIILIVVVAAAILFPVSMDAARRSKKTFPLMLGPKLSVGFFEGDESIYPVSLLGETMLNLYKNKVWVRTNILELTAYEGGMNALGINIGSPIEGVFMGSYKDWRPYGFGGLSIGVASQITDTENVTGWAGLTLGGGAGYMASRYSQFFAEGGVDLAYVDDDWNVRLFVAIGARFGLSW